MANENKNDEKVYVIDFIKKYNDLKSDTAKEEYLSSVVLKDAYVPYVTKMVTIDRMLQMAHYIDNRLIFNTPKEYQMYVFTLIMLYTRLDLDGNTSEIFDELSKNGLIDAIIESIESQNKADYKAFNTVFEMSKEDFVTNFARINLDTESIINAVGTGMMQGIMSIMDSISNVVNDPEMQEKINEYIKQINEGEITKETNNTVLSMI